MQAGAMAEAVFLSGFCHALLGSGESACRAVILQPDMRFQEYPSLACVAAVSSLAKGCTNTDQNIGAGFLLNQGTLLHGTFVPLHTIPTAYRHCVGSCHTALALAAGAAHVAVLVS